MISQNIKEKVRERKKSFAPGKANYARFFMRNLCEDCLRKVEDKKVLISMNPYKQGYTTQNEGKRGVDIMKKERGFTLVELLVVIAIIALLMSILIPALSRIRKQAKAVICQSNLRQWAIIFGMYTEDNEGYFCDAVNMLWTGATRPYYQNPDLCCCPMATKRWGEGGRGTFAAWDVGAMGAPVNWTGDRPGDYGSYGLNEWLYNPPPEYEYLWDSPTAYNWRHINVRGANNVPMFLGCWWLGGGPTHKDAPPVFEAEMTDDNSNDMKRFCLNRHNKTVNGCFMDFSVRKIPLKCLWKFKWNREYDINYGSPKWPPWMEKFPECD